MLSSKTNRWFAVFTVLITLTATMTAKTHVDKQAFGQTPEGTPVDLYSLADGKIEVRIMTLGGIIASLRTPDRMRKLDDVVLGCDSVEKYVAQTAHFGGIIGRYANRIAHGSFQRTMATTLFTEESAASTRWSGGRNRSRMESNLPM